MAHGPALSTARGVNIYVESEIRDSLSLLDVLYANQFEGESFDPELLEQTEKNLYRGASPKWLNFHISEQAESSGRGLSLIKRDGYDTLMQQILQRRKRPGVSTVKLSHQPGCGGTTLAMQVLWDLRKTLRCAVLTGSLTENRNIAKEVVQLYKAGNQDQHNTVLLLLNDEQIIENLQEQIIEEIAEQEIAPRMAVVIFLSCVRKDVVMHSDHVVLKRALSQTEKQNFNQKLKSLSDCYTDQHKQFHGFNIMQTDFSPHYVSQACAVFSNVRKANRPPKTQLAAFLALLNTYVPGSYLLESQCLDFLKLKDSNYREHRLEDRMKPFSHLIISYQQDTNSEKRVRMAHTLIAQSCTKLMAEVGVTRSDTARNFLNDLCKGEVPPCLLGFVKDMLTKRETKTEANQFNSAETEETRKFEKERFSRLILDIIRFEENIQGASVLKVASGQFRQNAFFPQALSRIYYLELKDYNQAEMWAKRAKERDPQNSFIADTLGQVYKAYLKKIMFSGEPHETLHVFAKKAIEAFKEEEQLAENEHATDLKGYGNFRVSRYFNTSGKFGYVEVCDIVYDVLHRNNVSTGLDRQINKLKDLVHRIRNDAKKHCDFLNAFLTYSKPAMQKQDASYNCKAVSSCYSKYVEHPLPDLVMEIVNKLRDDVNETVSSRGDDNPEFYIVALIKGWPTNRNRNSCNLMELIEKMRNSYESAYAKYFRSRYLCPLLYLGKDDKGVLNICVPTKREGRLARNETTITDNTSECLRGQEKFFRFNGVIKNYRILATVGGVEIVVKACIQNRVWKECEVSFYLGFTIRGLEAFDIQTKATENENTAQT
ncbi:Sterile alpha motif domain-containing protein 9-like [Channa argus]|uniref:Sterile alpha motif domain-containing protein 9-like n=1 Tax=Channa argus TaxID=215402 RepID=A0A6G1Q5F2_CHAAH|nr:Sterile alpha motif domain-containing protein 9-like [Channa argus]